MADEEEIETRREEIREALRAGLADIEAGRCEPWDLEASIRELNDEAAEARRTL